MLIEQAIYIESQHSTLIAQYSPVVRTIVHAHRARYITSQHSIHSHVAKGTTAKAQGTMAFAVGAVGYFKACTIKY